MAHVHGGGGELLPLALVTMAHLLFIMGIIIPTVAAGSVKTQTGYFKKCPDDHDVSEGSFVVLPCRQKEMNYKIFYTWQAKKDNDLSIIDEDVMSTVRRHYSQAGPLGDLTIRKADREEDNRYFTCIAHLQNDAQGCNAKMLTVIYIEPEVTVTKLKPAADVRVGDQLVLKCNVESRPKPSYFWFHNGMQLRQGSSLEQLGDGVIIKNDTLTIRNIKDGATGTYACMVRHHKATIILATEPYSVVVKGGGIPDINVAKGKDSVLYLMPGQRATLPCSTAQRGTTMRWMYATSLSNLEASQEMRISSSRNEQMASNNQDLVITSYVTPGLYICKVRTQSGAEVQFLYRVYTAENHPLSNKNNFEPPIVSDKPFVVREGNNFVLRVYVDFAKSTVGAKTWAPIPKMTWRKMGGEPITTTSRSGVTVTRKGRFLTFDSITRHHTGQYVLQLENVAGKKENKANIIVAFQPTIKREMPDKSILETKAVTFRCLVSANEMNPFPVSKIRWMRDNVILDSSKNPRYETNENSTIMVIRNVQAVDESDKYRCQIITTYNIRDPVTGKGVRELTVESNYFALSVQLKLKFTNKNVKRFLSLGTLSDLYCKAEGRGPLTYKFFKIESSGKIKLAAGEDEKYSIHLVSVADRGKYSCTVEDGIDHIEQKFDVTVGQKPLAELVDTTNATVPMGHDHFLHCKSSGYYISGDTDTKHKAKVTWFFRAKYGARLGENTFKIVTLPIYGVDTFDKKLRRHPLSKEISKNVQNLLMYDNGTLRIASMNMNNDGSYQCVVAMESVMSHSDKVYIETSATSGEVVTEQKEDMLRTVLIVVGCAIIYISLVIALTVYCSFNMWKRKAMRGMLMTTVVNNGNTENRKLANGSVPQENHRLINGVGKKGEGLEMEFTVLAPSTGTASVPSSGAGPAVGGTAPDARSYLSGLSGGSSGVLYGFSNAAGTPANSTVESTVERICRMYQVNRQSLTFLKGLLGRGLFGEVKVASVAPFSSMTNDPLVMVKYLANHDSSKKIEFINQIRMFAKFDHDFVTKLLGVCTEAGEFPCLILEYCENGNLFEFLRTMRQTYGPTSITEDNKLRMCLQVAQAMEHVHELGYSHRDLAAHNILVTGEHNLKLTNMGPCLDRFVGHYYGPLRKHQLLPIRWLPPEVIVGDYWTPQTDVWSYAIVVFEIFTYAQIPYAKMTDYSVLEAANRGSLLPEAPAGCPAELMEVLQKCWADEPCQRPCFSQLIIDVGDLTRDSADL